MPGRILAFGGFSIGTPFDDLALNLAAGTRVLFVPTAAGDPQRMLVAFYESFARRAEPAHRKLLCGWSAGMICWFEAGVTDSFGPELAGMRDGLGILAGSACPHYDGEARRRPVYTSLVQNGFRRVSPATTRPACSTRARSSSRSSHASGAQAPFASDGTVSTRSTPGCSDL